MPYADESSTPFREDTMPKPPRKRDATVADVANEARVSKATAARALGDYGAVSDAVRSRVLAAAETLGYRPNELARTMNTGKSHTIGVIVGDIENPYFGLVTRGISDVAKDAGYNVVLVNSGEDLEAEREAVRVLLDRRVDGLIVAPASSLEVEHLHNINNSGRALVLLDRRAEGIDAVVVEADLGAAAYEATALLTAEGHRRIAYISTLEMGGEPFSETTVMRSSSVADRLAAVLEAQRDAGIADPGAFVRLSANSVRPDGVKTVVRRLMEQENAPTAIIASDSLIALGVLRALRDLDLSVPDDVSFVMFDDFEWTSLMTPAITVVSQPFYEMGAEAARSLIDGIEHTAAERTPPTFTGRLIRRDSIAAPRQEPLVGVDAGESAAPMRESRR
jgi:LacI family transcriptional regulator